MNLTTIEQVKSAKKIIRRLNEEIVQLQNNCPHDKKIGTYGANTGNWCKSDDDYWISVTCLDCEKSYTIYHSEDPNKYKNFDGEIVR